MRSRTRTTALAFGLSAVLTASSVAGQDLRPDRPAGTNHLASSSASTISTTERKVNEGSSRTAAAAKRRAELNAALSRIQDRIASEIHDGQPARGQEPRARAATSTPVAAVSPAPSASGSAAPEQPALVATLRWRVTLTWPTGPFPAHDPDGAAPQN